MRKVVCYAEQEKKKGGGQDVQGDQNIWQPIVDLNCHPSSCSHFVQDATFSIM